MRRSRAPSNRPGPFFDRNGAVTSAVLVHLRVEPAHFDWRWRERPALALLAWEALGSRSAGERYAAFKWNQLERQFNFRCLRKLRDVVAGVLKGDEAATAPERYRIIKLALPAACRLAGQCRFSLQPIGGAVCLS